MLRTLNVLHEKAIKSPVLSADKAPWITFKELIASIYDEIDTDESVSLPIQLISSPGVPMDALPAFFICFRCMAFGQNSELILTGFFFG